MPGLYDLSSNANVTVTNTTGLYQLNSSVSVLNSAETLLALLSNTGTVGFNLTTSGQQVFANVLTSGVAAGTYGSGSAIPVITVGADGRITSISVDSASGGGYGNANVAAYLPTYTGSLSNSSDIITLYANAAAQTTAIDSLTINVNAFETYANLTFAEIETDFNEVNANIGAFETYANLSIVAINNNVAILTANLGSFETYANVAFNFYSNANVAAYLPTYTGSLANSSDIIALYANAATQQTYINTINANITAANTAIATLQANVGAFEIYANTAISTINSNVTAANLAIATLNANVGAFETYANIYFTNTVYSNANVASYLPTYSGTIGGNIIIGGNLQVNGTTTTVNTEIITGTEVVAGVLTANSGTASTNTSTGAIVAVGGLGVSGTVNAGAITTAGVGTFGNITTTNGLFWANGVSALSGLNYGNTQVQQYLSNYQGAIGNAQPGTEVTIFGQNGAEFVVGGVGGNLSISNTNGVWLESTNLTLQGAGDIRTLNGNLAISGNATVANVITTQGVYWANGVSYSSTFLTSGFTGNLGGNILYDGVNERIFANAFPLSTPPTVAGGQFQSAYTYAPVYTNGQLQQPPLAANTPSGATIVAQSAQILGMAQSANIALQSGYSASTQNRNTIGAQFTTFVVPVTANTMSTQDRVRGVVGSLEVDPKGLTWGTMSSSSQNSTTLSAINGITNMVNFGNVAALTGGAYGSFVTPAANTTSNVQYVTSIIGFLTLNATAGTTGKANIAYARLLAPSLSGFSSNLTIQNAIGLHTYSGWAGTVGTTTGAGKAYSVLNEDASTVIQTNGNVVITGNLQVHAYQETVVTGLSTGGAVIINVANGTIQQLTLSSNISSLAFTNMPAGGSVSLIITQGGTGGYTLTTTGIKYAGGSNTLSTAAGAIDMLNILFDGTNYYASLVKGFA